MSNYIPIKKAISSNVTGLDAIQRAPIVNFQTNHRCLRIQNVAHNEPFDKWGFTQIEESLFKNFSLKKEDIIISRTGGSIGSLIYVDKDYNAVFNNGLIRLKVNNEFDSKFIYYCLKDNQFKKHILRCSQGNSTQENVRMNDLLEYKIPEYSLKEQQAIAKILNQLDSKITLNSKINDNLQKQAKLLYDYWFNQFEFPNEEGKPYKSSGGKMVWNEELKREIPEGWEIVPFCKIAEFIKGKVPIEELVNTPLNNNYLKYITIDVTNGATPQYCSTDKMVQVNGETIMVMDGAASGDVYLGFDGILGSTFSKLIKKDANISDSLIFIMLKQHSIIYKKANTGSTVPHANANFIKGMKFVLPKNCKEYSQEFDTIYRSIITRRKENEQLFQLRNWLLPMLMNGQATVED